MIEIDLLILVLGLALIVIGADILVDGASSLARRFGMSEFVIGLTIVGMGTSAPEMVVSFIGAIKGSADIAMGNVFGSNIFNTLMILGASALILPINISRSNLRRDLPINIFATLLVILLCFSGGLSHLDGAILLLCFIAYMGLCFAFDEKSNNPAAEGRSSRLWVNLLFIVGGLAGLIAGGNLFVNSASSLARLWGASEKFIAITILAGGTSLPELATCLVAAMKKRGALALGNIIGSNIFNLLLILGGSALISPLSFASMGYVDCGILILSSLLLPLAAFTGRERSIGRLDGVLLLACWLGYITWLILQL